MKRGAGLLALALVAGACGSGGDDARTPEPTTTLANPRVEADVPAVNVTPLPAPAPAPPAEVKVSYYPVPAGSRPHDVAPAPDGTVWYTAQSIGELGKLDPVTGAVTSVKLGAGSAPHGVISAPTARPGSPTAGSMPSSGSTAGPTRYGGSPSPPARATST